MCRITRRKGSYNLVSPDEKQVKIALYLPEEAPQGVIAFMYEPGFAPSTSNLPPSELLKEFQDKLDSKSGYYSHRDEDQEAIDWARNHADELDRRWARRKREKLRERSDRVEDEIAELEQYL